MLGAVSLRLACLQSPSLYDTTHHRFCDMLRIVSYLIGYLPPTAWLGVALTLWRTLPVQ